MTFQVSAGVYGSIENQSYTVNGAGVLGGGVVISAPRGPVEINSVTSAREFIDTYGTPSQDNPSMYAALRFLRRAGVLHVRRVINDAVTATGEYITNVDPIFDITAANPGAWGNDIVVSFEDATYLTGDEFQIVVSYGGSEVERFTVSRDETAKNGYGNSIYIEDVVNNQSDYIRIVDDPLVVDALDFEVSVALASGADDTVAPTSAQIVTAWTEFENTEQVSARLLINAGWAVAEIGTKMLAVAETRGDALAILDVPEADAADVSAMITYRNTTLAANTYFGGMWGGWIHIYDSYTDNRIYIPASGDVAANIVQAIEGGEFWTAAAGLENGVVPNSLGVSKILTEGERDLLYSNGINPVTTISGTACVIWGQKTLHRAESSMASVNVVTNVLEINLRVLEALQPFVFRPNTAFTRDSINYLLSTYLDGIKNRGGLYGFSVDTSDAINDDSTTMYVDIYLQPTMAAEFIRVRSIVTPSGVTLV